MTKLLEEAVEAVRRMPSAAQDNIAQAMLSMAEIGQPDEIEPEHLQDVIEGLAEIERGDFASKAEVDAAFRSFER